MRPLTETIPKPLITFIDRAFLHHVLDHLLRHGIEEVILSSPYLEEAFRAFMTERGRGPNITWITEETPLGTAGAVANAARDLDETFLALNGDILTDLDVSAMTSYHREMGSSATLALTPVEDARPYGLVRLEAGKILEFKEKPTERIPGEVNAGTYVLEPEALAAVAPGRAVSIEKEVFPSLISSGVPLFGFVSHSYWMDLGTPDKYLRATFDALEGLVRGLSYVAPHVEPTARVALGSRLGRWVVVGADAAIGDGAQIEDSVVLARATVGAGTRVRDSIVGPGARVGDGAALEGSVLAEGAVVGAGADLRGARVSASAPVTRDANASPGDRD